MDKVYECRKCGASTIRDLHPNGDGSYTCISCLQDYEFLYWD